MNSTGGCFVVTLTYLVDLASVDAVLDQHVEWLQRQYDQGIFLMSGRLEPRTGGVIIACGVTRAELESVLDDDPFRRDQLAEHDVAEFRPSMARSDIVAGIDRSQEV